MHVQGKELRNSDSSSQANPHQVPTASLVHNATSTTQAGMLHISHTGSPVRPPGFDRCFKQGEERQQTVMLFERQMKAHFWEMDCLEAVETVSPVIVGLKESSREVLIAESGGAIVEMQERFGAFFFR